MKRVIAFNVLGALLLAGCMESLDEQTKKSPNSIFGKKTQDIGEFDPNANQQVSDSKVRITDTVTAPVTGPLQAYGPMMEQVSKLGVDHAIQTFYALEGRYPKDHEEFMEKVIKANRIQLPVLPAKAKYQYDVANHQLVVVKAEGSDAAGDAKPAKPAPVDRRGQ